MQDIVATPTAIEPCHYKVDITIPTDQVGIAFKQTLQQFRNEARIPGFRPGKSPEALVRKRFASAIAEESTRQLIQQGLQSALQAGEINPITMPTMASEEEPKAKDGEPFVFTIEFDVAPTFELPQYKGLELDRVKIEVSDKMVGEFIDNMLEQHSNYDKVDRAAATGDMLKVTYSTEIPEGETVPVSAEQLLNCEETWLILSDPEYLPGANEQLVGVAEGDERTISVAFPDDYHVDYLQGKSYDYKVVVHEVHGQVKPELTDDMAKTFGADTAEELHRSVREYLGNQVEQNQRQALEGQVYQQLDSIDDFDLPPRVLESEQSMALRNMLMQRQRQGADRDQLMSQAEDMREQAAKQARDRLKMRYIMEKIAEAEEITVSDEEVQTYVQGFQQQTGLSDTQFEQQFDSNMVAGQGRQSMLASRVMALIVDAATITEKEPEEANAEAAASEEPAEEVSSES